MLSNGLKIGNNDENLDLFSFSPGRDYYRNGYSLSTRKKQDLEHYNKRKGQAKTDRRIKPGR